MLRRVRKSINKSELRNYGQVIIEFTFCMIIVALMIYGIVKILRWTGVDPAQRRIAHDFTLTTGIVRDYDSSDIGLGPLRQVDTFYYKPIKMNAIWGGAW